MQYNMYMKRAVIACGAIAAAAQPAVAQSGRVSTPVGVVQVGIEGGASISNFIKNGNLPGGANDPNNRTGGYGGLSFIVQSNSSAVGLQTGVLYVQKGAKSSFADGSLRGGVQLGYVEVPVMLRLGVPLSLIGVAPTVVLGGSLGWRVNCKAVAEVGNFSGSSDCDNALLNQDLNVKRFDGGLTAGIEVPIKLGERYLAVPSVRYVRGLTRISDVGSNDRMNSTLLIGLGLRFR